MAHSLRLWAIRDPPARAHPHGLCFLISSEWALGATSCCDPPPRGPASPSFTLRPPLSLQGPCTSPPKLHPALPPAPNSPPPGAGFLRSKGQCPAPARLLQDTSLLPLPALPSPPAPITVTVRVYPRVASWPSHWGRHLLSGSHRALSVTTGALPSPHPAGGVPGAAPQVP